MVVFNSEWGYGIEFPIEMAAKLESLSEERFNELKDAVKEEFPMIDTLYSDEVKFNDNFSDYHWNSEDKKRETLELDKKLRAFINNWLKRKGGNNMTFWGHVKKRFEADLEVGWDYAMDNILRLAGCEDKPINALRAVYNDGYLAAINNDIDGGVCFAIREFAILQILEYIDDKISGGN